MSIACVPVVFPNRTRADWSREQPQRNLSIAVDLWSPNWIFDDATFEASVRSFENPDFVDVTIQSYRHRYGNAAGDPALEPIERLLEEKPLINVPTIVLHGAADGVAPPESSAHHAWHFTTRYERRVIPVAGHFISREEPAAVVQAVLDLL
jgi:pimeloyl-ACP methyl ester carboxylesterase